MGAMRGYIPPLSFAAVLGILSVATIVGVGVSVVIHRNYLIPVVIGAAIAVGIVYIVLTIDTGSSEPEPTTATGGVPVPAVLPASDAPGTATASDSVPGSAVASTTGIPIKEGPDDEPFYDPVEEADRLDSGLPPGGSPPSEGQDPK
jgi:hypothetical protein